MTLGTQFPKEMPKLLNVDTETEQPRSQSRGVGRCLWKRRHFRVGWLQRVSEKGMRSLWGHQWFCKFGDLWLRVDLSPLLRQDPWSRLLWGQNKWVWVISSYLSLLLAASLAAASPALIEVAATYVAAKVSATVTSHVRHLPSFQGMRVRPSGRISLSRMRSFGSLQDGMDARSRARQTRSLICWWRARWPKTAKTAKDGQDGRAYMRDHGCPCCRPMHRSCRNVRRRWVCRVANQSLRVSIRHRGAARMTRLARRVVSHHCGVRLQRGDEPDLNQ